MKKAKVFVIRKWKNYYRVSGPGRDSVDYCPFWNTCTYQQHTEKWESLNNALQLLQYRKKKDNADEELLRSFKVVKQSLRATEQAMEELYRRFGPKFVCTALVKLSESQRAMEKRLQNMIIRITKGEDVAEDMLLDPVSDEEDKLQQKLHRSELRTQKAKKEKEKDKTGSNTMKKPQNTNFNNRRNQGFNRSQTSDTKRQRREGDSKNKTQSGPVCFLCHKGGHMKKDS